MSADLHRDSALPARSTAPTHRWLAVAAGAVAVPAAGGAVSLADGTIDMGEAIVDRFPWQSVELAGFALLTWVAVPFGALAVLAWRGSTRAPRVAMAAGLLLVAWIAVQVLIIRTLSFFHPTYLAIGLSFACVGRHLERLEHQGPADPEPGTIGPVAEPSASQTIGA
jgi:hypothetical protein